MASSSERPNSTPDAGIGNGKTGQPWSIGELIELGWSWNEAVEEPAPPGDGEELATRRRNAEFDTTSTQYPLPPVSL